MDMSNIPAGEIVASNIDVNPINEAIRQRAMALAGQMNPEAAAQFESDMSAIECSVSGSGNTVSFSLSPNESYLLNYLKGHGTPVSGGDGGMAHNVDGSVYSSAVPHQLQGTPLPGYELPTLDGEDEAGQIMELMSSDAAQNGFANSQDQIGAAIAPKVGEEISKLLGGVAS